MTYVYGYAILFTETNNSNPMKGGEGMAKGKKKAARIRKTAIKVTIQILTGIITGTALLLIDRLLGG